MHRGVAIAMENDGRHGRAGPVPLPHRDERGGKVAGGAAGQTGMYADGGVQVGIRHWSAGAPWFLKMRPILMPSHTTTKSSSSRSPAITVGRSASWSGGAVT